MTSETLETIKVVTPVATPLIKALLDEWLVPAVKDAITFFKEKNAIDEDKIRSHFNEYLLRYYAKTAFASTLVFGNQQVRLVDIYLPLTIENRKNGKKFQIKSWEPNFIPWAKRVLVTDTAGMGKSTLLKRLFLACIEEKVRLPIFVELRTLDSKKTLCDKILEELGELNQPFPKDVFFHLLKTGGFVFYLDGFDEIPLEGREAVTRDLQDFVSRALNNWFVLSSRFEGALGSFGDFQEFGIAPLKKEEAFQLLRLYDKGGKYAEKLISELQGSKFNQIKDLLRNPMLVSLLFKAYSYKPKIHLKKHIFYRQVFDALFESHDLTKGECFAREKASGLDIDDFHSILRELGFITAKGGRVEFTKDKFLALLKEIKKSHADLEFAPTDFLKDLITTVPLFTCEGEIYNWAHRSVQDYFAAQFIYYDAKDEQKSILEKIYSSKNSNSYRNILDIYHDTDPKVFRRVLTRRLLRDFIHYYETSYQKKYRDVSAEALDRRKCGTFGREIIFCNLSKDDKNGNDGKDSKNRKKSTNGRSVHKDFNRLIDIVGKTYSVAGRIRQSVLWGEDLVEGHRLAMVEITKPGLVVLLVLADKRYAFVEHVSPPPRERYKGQGMVEDVPVIIDDDPDGLLNNPSNFVSVTETLAEDQRLLSYESSKKYLKAIDEDVVGESSQKTLSDDI